MIGRFARSAFFVLLPAVGVGGALGLPLLTCLAGAASLRPSLLQQAVKTRPLALVLLLAFIALAAASALWSEHAAGPQAAKIAAIAVLSLMFAVAAARDPRLTQAGAIAAVVVLTVLLGIEALTGLLLNRGAQPDTDIDELGRNVSRAASLLMVLTWSAAAALAARPGLIWKASAAAVLAGAGYISLQFGQTANAIAFAAGLGVFLAAFAAPRVTLTVVLAGLLVWLVAAPLATPLLGSAIDAEALPRSWNERVTIWEYVCQRIWEQPWIGHGLDASRAHLPAIPVHPHSASLQIWFELGVLGIALAAALLIAGGRDIVRRFGDNRPAAAAAAGTLAAIGVIANISFNLWAEWWFATMFVGAGIVGALGRAPR